LVGEPDKPSDCPGIVDMRRARAARIDGTIRPCGDVAGVEDPHRIGLLGEDTNARVLRPASGKHRPGVANRDWAVHLVRRGEDAGRASGIVLRCCVNIAAIDHGHSTIGIVSFGEDAVALPATLDLHIAAVLHEDFAVGVMRIGTNTESVEVGSDVEVAAVVDRNGAIWLVGLCVDSGPASKARHI